MEISRLGEECLIIPPDTADSQPIITTDYYIKYILSCCPEGILTVGDLSNHCQLARKFSEPDFKAYKRALRLYAGAGLIHFSQIDLCRDCPMRLRRPQTSEE